MRPGWLASAHWRSEEVGCGDGSSFHQIPHMLDGIHVRGSAWPPQSPNAELLLPLLDRSRSVWGRVVIL